MPKTITFRCVRDFWVKPDDWEWKYTQVKQGQKIQIAPQSNIRGEYAGKYRLMDHWGITFAHISKVEVEWLTGKKMETIIEEYNVTLETV